MGHQTVHTAANAHERNDCRAVVPNLSGLAHSRCRTLHRYVVDDVNDEDIFFVGSALLALAVLIVMARLGGRRR